MKLRVTSSNGAIKSAAVSALFCSLFGTFPPNSSEIKPNQTATKITAIQGIGALCDAELPSLRQYDQWGRRIDELTTSQGWRAMKAIAFQEGLISIAYDRERYQEWARVYMFAKVLMFDADCRMVRFLF